MRLRLKEPMDGNSLMFRAIEFFTDAKEIWKTNIVFNSGHCTVCVLPCDMLITVDQCTFTSLIMLSLRILLVS